MKALIFAFFVLLSGCGAGSNSPASSGNQVSKAAEISCADVYATGAASRCDPKTASIIDWLIPSASADTVIINAGDISRDAVQMVNSRADVVNPLDTDTTIYVEMKFDAGCNGATEWVIFPKQKKTIAALTTGIIGVGGMCGDMALGARTMTATMWGPDSVTVLGTVIVNFNLISAL